MAMSGKFSWEVKHQKAWRAVLLLACLGFESNVIEGDKPLSIATDGSQIAISYVLFQIVAGEIKVIDMDSKILKAADRNKASSFREAIGLIYALMSNETTIKSHAEPTVALTDCMGLSHILRSSNNNSKLLEYAIYRLSITCQSVIQSVQVYSLPIY